MSITTAATTVNRLPQRNDTVVLLDHTGQPIVTAVLARRLGELFPARDRRP